MYEIQSYIISTIEALKLLSSLFGDHIIIMIIIPALSIKLAEVIIYGDTIKISDIYSIKFDNKGDLMK